MIVLLEYIGIICQYRKPNQFLETCETLLETPLMYAVGYIYHIVECKHVPTSVYTEHCRLITYLEQFSTKGALLQLQADAILK